MTKDSKDSLRILQDEIVACERCERLRTYDREVARVKRRAYLDWEYWGKPVPSFGDPNARVLVLGLAPGAHGANRTGRMFTGDKSGDFLYDVLYDAGFASQPHGRSADDGLMLKDLYISASAHCAPPDNKPLPQELRNCRDYFERELKLLTNVRVVVALGKIAFDTYLSVLKDRGEIRSRAEYPFGHNVVHPLTPLLIGSYHPSQQNTSTGKLTKGMLLKVFYNAASAANSTRLSNRKL